MSLQRLKDTFYHLFHPQASNNHRPLVLHADSLLVLSSIVVVFGLSLGIMRGLPGTMGLVLGFSSSITPTQVIDQINQKREELNLKPLTLNPQLSQAALAKATDMFEKQYWAHYAPDGTSPWSFIKNSGYKYTVAGENLARDFFETSDMVDAWMNSETHRENIVNPKYQETGIAVVDGSLQGVDTTLVVQLFGSTTAQIAEKPTSVGEKITYEVATQELPAGDLSKEMDKSRRNEVLAASFTDLSVFKDPILLSPIHLSKAFFLAVIMMIISVLFYDTIIIERRQTVRLVGKNIAHISLFFMVFFLVLFFKGGLVR